MALTETFVTLPAWARVDVVPLPDADADVEGVCGTLLVLRLELDLRWREGVGCVAPVSWWAGLGSEMSMGRSDAEVELEDWEALDVTDAVWARRAVNSRVRRLTCHILALFIVSV